MNNLSIKKSMNLKADQFKVWEALTKPEIIEQYLMGAKVESDWKVGSKIVYSGNFAGTDFRDEGIIDIFAFPLKFQYSYWSANHGTENTPENYVTICYSLHEISEGTKLEVSQWNYKSKELAEIMDGVWEMILGNLKKVVESS